MPNYDIAGFLDRAEAAVLDMYIRPDTVVFDVGANIGAWSAAVLSLGRPVRLHLFEPVPRTFEDLIANPHLQGRENVVFNRQGLAEATGERALHVYRDHLPLTSFYRRNLPMFDTIAPPETEAVPVESIDDYCRRTGVRHIHFLKLDVEGAELDVLAGAERMLGSARIDFIQFEYGGTYRDAGITLRQVYERLTGHGYWVYAMTKSHLVRMPEWLDGYEDYGFRNHLAVHERLSPYFFKTPPLVISPGEACLWHGIQPRGVLHVGANEGGESDVYRTMGVERVIYVEANPRLAHRLAERFADEPGVDVVGCAAGERSGSTRFHLASNPQCSSTLPFGHHRTVYPDVTEVETIDVEVCTVDSILAGLGRAPQEISLLNIDVQGAELSVLKGAVGLLPYVEGILTEVNFDELYEGCAQIDDIDEFLRPFGFRRVLLTCPFHPSWGDAFYVRDRKAATG